MEIPEEQEKKVAHVRAWVAARATIVRNSAGLTQQQVADKMGIHLSRVNDFEKNRTDAKGSTVYRFCLACGISVEKFYQGCPVLGKKAKQEEFLVTSEDSLTEKMKAFGFDPKDVKGFIKSLKEGE